MRTTAHTLANSFDHSFTYSLYYHKWFTYWRFWRREIIILNPYWLTCGIAKVLQISHAMKILLLRKFLFILFIHSFVQDRRYYDFTSRKRWLVSKDNDSDVIMRSFIRGDVFKISITVINSPFCSIFSPFHLSNYS